MCTVSTKLFSVHLHFTASNIHTGWKVWEQDYMATWKENDEVTYRHTENGPSSCKPSEQPSKEEESYETISRSIRIVEKPGIGNEEPPTNGRNTSNHQCRLAAKQLSHWPCKQSSKDSPQGKECLHRRNSTVWSVQCWGYELSTQ